MPRTKRIFDGAEYVDERDGERLTNQYDTIFNIMKDGAWRSVRQLRKLTGYPENSIQAQLRHSRKERFGAHELNKKYQKKGLYLYQLIVNPKYLENPVPEIEQNEKQTITASEIVQPSPVIEITPLENRQKSEKKDRPLPLFLFLEQQEQIISPIKQTEIQIA